MFQTFLPFLDSTFNESLTFVTCIFATNVIFIKARQISLTQSSKNQIIPGWGKEVPNIGVLRAQTVALGDELRLPSIKGKTAFC